MAKGSRPRPWASNLAPLMMIVLQAPLSAAHPFVNNGPYQNASTTPSNLSQGSLSEVVSTTTSCSENFTAAASTDDWQATVAQISDGQIQAPYRTKNVEHTRPTSDRHHRSDVAADWTQTRRHSFEPSMSPTASATDSASVSSAVSTTDAPSTSASSSASVDPSTNVSLSTTEVSTIASSSTSVDLSSTTSFAVVNTTTFGTTSVITTSVSVVASSIVSSPISTFPVSSTNSSSVASSSVASSSVASPSTTNSSISSASSTSSASPSSSLASSSASASSTSSASPHVSTITTTTESSTTTTEVTVLTTSVPDASLTSLTTSEVQTATGTLTANSTGSIVTSLQSSLGQNSIPFATSVPTATSTLSLIDTSTLSSIGPTATTDVTSISAANIFQPIATGAPPSQITSTGNHPVPTSGIQSQQSKLQTNKFYANFFLGDQTSGTWTHPYSMSWSKGTGTTGSWGLDISHVERDQLAYGSADSSIDAGQSSFFAAPLGIDSLVMSAAELSNDTTLTTSSLEAFSVNVELAPTSGANPTLTFPLLQGMGFITGIYNDGTPLIQSGIGITALTYIGAIIDGTTYKYSAELANGRTWLVYVTPANEGYNTESFTLLNTGTVQGPSGFDGYIQIAKLPTGATDVEDVYDGSAGAYATAATISGSVQGTTGSYTLAWTKEGVTSQPLLMWALPHHVASFDSTTSPGLTDLSLVTTTKGFATAVKGDSWDLVEPSLPISMGFAPWSPEQGDLTDAASAAAEAINAAATEELSQNVADQTTTGSLYYDGKALAKFAAICYAANDLAGNETLAYSGLQMLESAFEYHVNNEMEYPLVYDTVWGGVVSDCSYIGDGSGCDFGNTYYNDHHFHYGYFVYAAAVIGYLDPDWLNQGTNKAWVNTLVRDYGNSITDDPYFPFARMFDWYHGHSWAHGLIQTADGKDQESSSEDTMASYGMKMWGQIIGDTNMEARGNLMLAIQARSLQSYYLYTDDNTVEPAEFIGNKAAGILFENKIDHTTYFGNVVEYIEGIHMLPLMPFSPLIRTQTFVQQEWNAYFATTGLRPVDQVTGGWRGILEANYAIVDPTASYSFFSDSDFDTSYLDGGASQTWYLAFSAGLGGYAGGSKVKRDAWTVSEEVSMRVPELDLSVRSDGFGSRRSSRLRQRTSRNRVAARPWME